jgi:zinc-ribbon domain
MFCWSCGHENSDSQKFCGECGKSLFKPEKVVQDIATSKNFSRPAEKKPVESNIVSPVSTQPDPPPPVKPVLRSSSFPPVPPARPIETKLTSREPEIPKQTNPLIEESRVVHEKPVATSSPSTPSQNAALPPTPIRNRVPNRITGPSFLGLSDEPGDPRNDESSYLLDDEESGSSSPWRGYLLLAVLVVVSLLVIRNWQDLRAMATDYSQKLGVSDAPKHPAGPERVTASNDASKMTPDAAAEEGKTSTPAENETKDSSKPQQTAKLDKPQSDNEPSAEAAKEDKSSAGKESSSEESAKPAATKERAAPAPAYDNSQLEEAQKYLQGRGVPQDCNRGVGLLQSAAKEPNPKARIQMAALYASGHCVSEDLAQAYNWFSRAQELEPHNRLIERNLDSLWARMSDQDRRRVLR